MGDEEVGTPVAKLSSLVEAVVSAAVGVPDKSSGSGSGSKAGVLVSSLVGLAIAGLLVLGAVGSTLGLAWGFLMGRLVGVSLGRLGFDGFFFIGFLLLLTTQTAMHCFDIEFFFHFLHLLLQPFLTQMARHCCFFSPGLGRHLDLHFSPMLCFCCSIRASS